jgi:hypothetical protein
MTEQAITLNGKPCERVSLHVSEAGAWLAEVVLADATLLSGRANLAFGGVSCVGTIDPERSGSFADSTHVRLVGGLGWSRVLPRTAYSNDAGVKAQKVASDAAAAVGEILGTFEPAAPRLASPFARRVGAASLALESAAGGVPWYVDLAGVTHVAARKTYTPNPKAYHVESWDPIAQRATICVEDPGAIGIGAKLADERFSGVQVVREYTLTAEGSTIYVHAICGAALAGRDPLVEALGAFVRHTVDPRLHSKWRYRVESMAPDGRANVVAINDRAPFPTLARVPVYSSVYVDMSAGAVVLVEFLEGDPSQARCEPVADTRDAHFAPERTVVGGTEGADIACKGHPIEGLLPPATFTGTINGLPATGVVIWAAPKVLGTITAGSSKAGAAQ